MMQPRRGLFVLLVLGTALLVGAMDDDTSSEVPSGARGGKPSVDEDVGLSSQESGATDTDVEDLPGDELDGDVGTSAVVYAGHVVPLHSETPIPDNDLSPVGNFKYCVGRNFNHFSEFSGLAFISGVVAKSGENGAVEVQTSMVKLYIATGEKDKISTYDINEIPPVDDTSRPLYLVSGFDQVFQSLPLAVEAAAQAANIPMERIYFPIAECGGLYADHTNMQSKSVIDAIAGPSTGYQEKDGGVFAQFTERCATNVFPGLHLKLGEFYTESGASPSTAFLFRQSSSKTQQWTLQSLKISSKNPPVNFRYLGFNKRGVKGDPPVLGYHYLYGDATAQYPAPPQYLATLSKEELVEKFSQPMAAIVEIGLVAGLIAGGGKLKMGYDSFPDYYCGGQGIFVGPNHAGGFGPRAVSSTARGAVVENGIPVGVAPWMAAWARGLSGVIPLPESEAEGTSLGIDPAVAAKCASFFSSRGIEIVTGRDLGVSFSEVAGNTVGKKALWDNVLTPFIMGDVKNSRNILQYGPPGTGKSLLAKALVGELNKVSAKMGRKKKVTYIPITASNLEEKWIGKSEENVKTLFDCARAYSPTVIFFDEVDGLFRKRSSSSSESSTKVKSEFLVQLDGSFASKKDEMVVFLGATNRPMDLDSAFRRRLPVGCYVGLPSMAARAAIIKMKLASYLPENFDDPDKCEWYRPFLQATLGYSGSDLVNLAKEAIVLAKERAMESRTESLPAKIKAALEDDPEMRQKMEEIGVMAILQANKPGSRYEMTQQEMTNFVSEAQAAVARNTKVATGLKMEDSELLIKAFKKIKRSVTRSEIYPLYDFILSTNGPEVVEVPKSYRLTKGASVTKSRSASPLLGESDVDWVNSL